MLDSSLVRKDSSLVQKDSRLVRKDLIFVRKDLCQKTFVRKERIPKKSKNNGGFSALSYDRSSLGKQSTSFGKRTMNNAVIILHWAIHLCTKPFFMKLQFKTRKWRAEISVYTKSKHTKIFRISSSNQIRAGFSLLAHVLIDSQH